MKTLLSSIFFISGLFVMGQSWGENEEQTFASYPSPESMKVLKIIKPDEPIEKMEPGTYSVKAYISLKTEKGSEVFEDWNFKLPAKKPDASDPKEKGWSVQRQKYLWRPIAMDESILIPLTPDSSKKIPYIANFNQLHIDYEELYPSNPSQMYLEMAIKSDESGKTLNTAGGQLGTPLLENLDVSSAQWEKKDWVYLAKRTMGLPLDSTWKYSQSGPSAVLQKRFRRNLKPDDEMFLHFSEETEAEKIKITLRLGFDKLFETPTIVFWEDIPKGPVRTIDNRHILPINLGELVRTRFSHKKNVILKEIAIFIPNQQAQESTGRLLEEVVFLKQQNQNQKFDLVFPASTKIISDRKKRLVLDIRRLSEKVDLDSKLIKMNLTIQPKSIFSPSGLIIKRVRMVALVNNRKPLFLVAKEKQNRKWGGPFLVAEHDDNHSEWIQMDSYLDFRLSRISYKNKAQEDQKEDNFFRTQKKEIEKKNYKIFRKSITTKEIGGITATASVPFRDWVLDSNGLTLEGDGRWMKIDWPVKAHLQSATRFFAKVPSGTENIVLMELTPIFKGKKLSSHKFFPNRPVHITGKPQVIDHLKVRILFRGSSFRLTLQELALFTPLAIPKTEILDTPTLISSETPLISEQKPYSLESQPFYAPNSLNPGLPDTHDNYETIKGSLEINRKVEWIDGLKIKYNPLIDSQEQYISCWLQLTMVGTKHKFEKTICPEQSSEEIFISQKDLFDETRFSAEEIIRKITWKIFTPATSNKEQSSSTRNIMMSIQGLDIRSIRSDLLMHPLLQLKGETIFPASLKNKSENSGLLKEDIWLDLGLVSITESDAFSSIFQFMDHPYLQNNMLVLEKSKPFSYETLAHLKENQLFDQNSFQPSPWINSLKKLLAVLAIIFILGWIWWIKGIWWKKGGLSFKTWTGKFFLNLTTRPTKFLKKATDRFGSLENLFILFGILAILIGILAIYLGKNKDAVIFFQISVFILYRHLILKSRSTIETRWPLLAGKIYEGPGTHYIAGFLVTILVAAFLFIVKLNSVASKFVDVGYLMLIIGIIKESMASRNTKKVTNSQMTTTKNETTRA